MMGIAATGIRETAKNNGDREALSNAFSSLLTLNAIGAIIAIVALALVTWFVPTLREYWQLMLIGGVKIVLNLFLIEWFFKGLENFRYITIRSILLKAVFVAAVFIFVRKAGDYVIYYALMSALIVANAGFNWFYSRKFVSFDIHNISLKTYYKPFLTIGVYLLVNSVSSMFNITYLGFVGGVKEVGYYTTAIKLYGISLSIFTAFTGVMLPRMSALVSKKNIDEVKRLTTKSLDVLLFFSFPIIALTVVYAPEIIRLIAGPGFEGAIVPMRVTMSLVLLVGLEQILVLQILMPLKEDKYILINAIIKAAVGIAVTLLLVNRLLSTGAAIVTVCSQVSVCVVTVYFVWKSIKMKFSTCNFLINLTYGAIFILVCLLVRHYASNLTGLFLSAVICGALALVLQIYISKNEFVIDSVRQIRRRIT